MASGAGWNVNASINPNDDTRLDEAERALNEEAAGVELQTLALAVGIDPSTVDASMLDKPWREIEGARPQALVLKYRALRANANSLAHSRWVDGGYGSYEEAAAVSLRVYYERFCTGTDNSGRDVEYMIGLLPEAGLSGADRRDLALAIQAAVTQRFVRQEILPGTDQTIRQVLGQIAGPRGRQR